MHAAKFERTDTNTDRNREDTADDTDLAINITDAVNTAKNWASRGASKIDETVSFLPGGKDTKDLITPLLGSGDYSTAAKDVRGKWLFQQ